MCARACSCVLERASVRAACVRACVHACVRACVCKLKNSHERSTASEHIRKRQKALLECKVSAWCAQVTDVFDASLNPRKAVRVHLRKRPPGTNFVPSSTPAWDPDYNGSVVSRSVYHQLI